MTSSTKPEVHNASKRRQRKIELYGHRHHHRKSVKFGRVYGFRVMLADRQTDRQTHLSQYFRIRLEEYFVVGVVEQVH